MPANATIRPIDTLPAPLKLYGAALLTLRKKPSSQATLPTLTLVRPAIRLDVDHIARYARLCEFKPEQGLPLTYPHMLAFPLHMLLMADTSFPYSMMGLVHLANTVQQHTSLQLNHPVRIEVRCGHPQAHEKGQAFSLLTQARQGNELVWESESVYLRTGIRQPSGDEYLSHLTGVPSTTQPPVATWQIDSGIGRRYGALSGDLNPIHLHRLGAMALGFPRAIAHGMWAKARALATLMPAHPLPTAVASVEFKTPLFLPAQARLWADTCPSVEGKPIEQRFELKDQRGEKPHLRGVWHE